jgi:hypothetical protein
MTDCRLHTQGKEVGMPKSGKDPGAGESRVSRPDGREIAGCLSLHGPFHDFSDS